MYRLGNVSLKWLFNHRTAESISQLTQTIETVQGLSEAKVLWINERSYPC